MAQELIATLEETRTLAASFAKNAKPGDCYCLTGDLGAGKTEFARSFIQALCGDINVSSPTFNIAQFYEPNIYHFDLYRIETESQLEELGLEEALETSICLIEWPSIAEDFLPPKAVKINLEILDDEKRRIIIHDK